MIANMLSTWTEVSEWIFSTITSSQAIFVSTEGTLTFLGVLGVVGVGFGATLLGVGIVQNFLHLRG